MQADDARQSVGPNWAAVAWAEALSVAGLILVAVAVARSVEDRTISLGCENGSSSSGGVLLLRSLDSSYLPALAVALAIQGGIAVRPPSRRAIGARVVVIAVLFLLASAVASGRRPSDGTLILLVLLAIPSVGVADAIAGSLGRRRQA